MNQQTWNSVDELHRTGLSYDWYYRTSKWLAATVALIVVLVLVGWTFHINRLTRLSPDFTAMKVTTAIGLLFLAGALLLLNQQIIRPDSSGTRVRNGVVFVLATMAGLLGLGTLLGYATHVEVERVPPSWTVPATALCFVFLGGAVPAAMKQNARHYVSQSLAAVVIFICSLATLGYHFHKQSLYAIPSYKSMVLHTAVSFVLLSLALLCLRPDRGLMKTATADTAGGSMLQRMVPMLVGMVLVIGWVYLMGETTGLYNSRFSLLVTVGLSVTGVSVILWTVARSLNQLDAARGLSERRRQHAIQQLRVSDEQKTRLLYTVSHEYRTPLNGMIGIAPEDQTRTFDEFVQLRHPLQQRIGGQGLGLALCKRLADVPGAIITVESQPGKGSTFSVTVPCERRTSAAMVEGGWRDQEHVDMPESGTLERAECRSDLRCGLRG